MNTHEHMITLALEVIQNGISERKAARNYVVPVQHSVIERLEEQADKTVTIVNNAFPLEGYLDTIESCMFRFQT